jgi:predicted ATP-grasp superfamily ATP-dependent carboligase
VKIRSFPREFLPVLEAAPEAPWMYTGGLENHPRLVDRLAKVRPLWGNSGSVLRRVRDPERLSAAVREAGFRFPELAAGQRALIKPRSGSGGIGVRFASEADHARLPRGSYLQAFVDGQAESAAYVAARGSARLLGATRQLLRRDFDLTSPFLHVGSLGPLQLHHSVSDTLRRLGQMLADRFGLVGLFNVDYVRVGQEVWPVEINPRYSASMEVLERATAVRHVALHAAACERNTLPSADMPTFSHVCGKAIVYAEQDVVIAPAFDELANAWQERDGAPALADLPRIGEFLSKGQPVTTVLAKGESLHAVGGTLRRRVTEMQQLLARRSG